MPSWMPRAISKSITNSCSGVRAHQSDLRGPSHRAISTGPAPTTTCTCDVTLAQSYADNDTFGAEASSSGAPAAATVKLFFALALAGAVSIGRLRNSRHGINLVLTMSFKQFQLTRSRERMYCASTPITGGERIRTDSRKRKGTDVSRTTTHCIFWPEQG